MPHGLATNRPGFTVVEQLVALVVLGVGLLAIARGIVGLQQHARRAALRLNATSAATSAVERMTASTCASASGDDTIGPVSVSWTRTGGAPAATITALAEADVGGTAVADSLTSARGCRPGA